VAARGCLRVNAGGLVVRTACGALQLCVRLRAFTSGGDEQSV
jgi:hypothetical protein